MLLLPETRFSDDGAGFAYESNHQDMYLWRARRISRQTRL